MDRRKSQHPTDHREFAVTGKTLRVASMLLVDYAAQLRADGQQTFAMVVNESVREIHEALAATPEAPTVMSFVDSRG